MAGARGDTRLLSQRLTEQAAQTARRFRVALGEGLLEQAKGQAPSTSGAERPHRLREGDPAAAILNVAGEEKADIIVVGCRGLGDLAGLLLCSVSHKVTHLAECACLTVK